MNSHKLKSPYRDWEKQSIITEIFQKWTELGLKEREVSVKERGVSVNEKNQIVNQFEAEIKAEYSLILSNTL